MAGCTVVTHEVTDGSASLRTTVAESRQTERRHICGMLEERHGEFGSYRLAEIIQSLFG